MAIDEHDQDLTARINAVPKKAFLGGLIGGAIGAFLACLVCCWLCPMFLK